MFLYIQTYFTTKPSMNNELPLEYEQLLSKSKIAPKYHSFYKHWLKNYLSFCNTNNLNVNDKLNLDPFLKFLQLRNYQEFQIKQAHHAVFLFHMSNDEKNVSLPEKSIIPTNTAITNHTDFKEVWNTIFEQFKTEIQLRHYSQRTFEAYGFYLRRLAVFTDWKDPHTLTSFDVKRFLALMATSWKSSASSQNLAFNSFLFLFKFVIRKPYENLSDTPRAKTRKTVPQILSQKEISNLLRHLQPPYSLIAALTYGCGLRLNEVLNLRVNNFNLDNKLLSVCFGKGGKSRYLPLPESAVPEINRQMYYVRNQHKKDLEQEYDGTFLSVEIERKSPDAARKLEWQWFFPAQELTYIPEIKQMRRYHVP